MRFKGVSKQYIIVAREKIKTFMEIKRSERDLDYIIFRFISLNIDLYI